MSDEILDLAEVLERVQNDQELLVELIDIFLDDVPKKIAAMKKAVKDKDFVQIADLAHSMKGSSANLAAKSISALFLRIEQMGKGKDSSGIEATLIEVEENMDQLRRFFVEYKKSLDHQ